MSDIVAELDRWPLVRVRWMDSIGQAGWNSLSYITEDHSLECVSVGWMVQEKNDRIVLVSHIQDASASDPKCDGHITIPRQAIIKVDKSYERRHRGGTRPLALSGKA